MKLSRRGFLKTGAVAGGGLALGFYLLGEDHEPYPHASHEDLQPNAFLQVTPEGRVILQIHKVEMGQGVVTGLVTLVAEELHMPPAMIDWEFSGVHPDYVNPDMPIQGTAASTSMKTCFIPVREAAARVRMLLIDAAAREWGVPGAALALRDGMIIEGDGRTASIGAFVARARTLPVPEIAELTAPDAFEYIGRYDARLDTRVKVTGAAEYGIDKAPPDALVAVLVRCPHFGGTLEHVDATAAGAVAGVKKVFEIDRGIAVVATNYWAARRGAEALEVTWSPAPDVSNDSIARAEQALLDQAVEDDDPLTGDAVVSADYTVPFEAHACMEPMNATVAMNAGGVDVWTSNQAPDVIQAAVAAALDRPRREVTVHTPFAGGGFGRRSIPDAAVEAALIAAKMEAPVQLIWSREDDIQHDFYRPRARARMSAALRHGRVTHWRYRVAAPSIFEKTMPEVALAVLPEWVTKDMVATVAGMAAGRDTTSLSGVTDTPYLMGEVEAEYIAHNPGIPVSYWRAVGNSFNGFFVDGFIDELAVAAGADPVQFRRDHLDPASRERAVLDLVAEKGGWGSPAEGQSQGIALDHIKGSSCAMVADVSVEGDRIRVRRIIAAVDCGQVINPDIVRAQVESCIVFGLTAAMKGGITIKDGSVQQSNFHDYPMLRMGEMPAIVVHIVDSDRPPTGVGEIAVAPVAPAVANAVFMATGKRLRSLPLTLA